MITVENLTKRYGATLALAGLNLTVPEGTLYGLIGPNGSGKSTLLKLLMGFIFPDAGAIDLGTLTRPRIGYTPDRPYLPVRFRAAEFLTLAGELSGLSGQSLRAAVTRRLQQVGLQEAANQRISALSKGMLQRLSLASALLHDPPLLLLDEPMSGLDPGQQAILRYLIRELHAEGRTILMSTHRLSEVANLCTHVAILKQGRLVRAGELQEVLRPRPQVILSVDHLPPELATTLTTRYPGLCVKDNTLFLDTEALEHKRDILRELLDAGCDIQRLSQERATLEEVYLEAVRA